MLITVFGKHMKEYVLDEVTPQLLIIEFDQDDPELAYSDGSTLQRVNTYNYWVRHAEQFKDVQSLVAVVIK